MLPPSVGIATLVIGFLLVLAGALGHSFGTRDRKRETAPDERRARGYFLTIGSIVLGVFLIGIAVSWLLHVHSQGH